MVSARRLERSRKDHRSGSDPDGTGQRRDAAHAPERLSGRGDRPLQAADRRTRRDDRSGSPTGSLDPLHGTRRREPPKQFGLGLDLRRQIQVLRSKPLSEPFPSLYLDAPFLGARWARGDENVFALVAYGVDFGHRRLLGTTIEADGWEESWSALLSLCDRGLSGGQLRRRLDLRRQAANRLPSKRASEPDPGSDRVPVGCHYERHPVSYLPQGPLAPQPLHQRPRAPLRRYQAPHLVRRCFPVTAGSVQTSDAWPGLPRPGHARSAKGGRRPASP